MYKRRKNIRKAKGFDWYGVKQRFSIRKYHFGAASVLLGTLLPMVSQNVSHAQETVAVERKQADKEPVTYNVEYVSASGEVIYRVQKRVNLSQTDSMEVNETASELDTEATLQLYELADEETRDRVIVLTKDEEPVIRYVVKEKETVSSPSVGTVLPRSLALYSATSASEHAQMQVNFYDADGNKLDESSIYSSATGQNMNITMEVIFPEGATNKQVELTLGRFLRFADDPKTAAVEGTGATNETIKSQATVSAPVAKEKEVKSVAGQSYVLTGNNPSKYKVTYQVKDTAVSLRIPLIVNSDKGALLKGMSPTGSVNGETEGIEKDTPFLVVSTATLNGQTLQESSTINQLSIATDYTPILPHIHTTNYGVNVEYANANNRNGYFVEFASGFSSRVGLGESSRPHLMYEAGTTFDIVTPTGVTVASMGQGYTGYSDAILKRWEIVETTTDTQGNNVTTVRVTQPIKTNTYAPFIRYQVDRGVFKGEEVRVVVRNPKVLLRNYTTPFTTYNVNGTNVLDTASFRLQVAEYNEDENIGFLRVDKPGVYENINLPIRTTSESREGHYAGLGTLGYRYVQNFNDTPTRPKELHYEFPSQTAFEVKGLKLGGIDNGYTITTIQVKSKNHPEWKTVTLPKAYIYNQGNVFVDLATLGLSEDDVLTEAIVPIGVIPAKYEGIKSHFTERGSNVFGVLKEDFTGAKTSAIVTLRDMDYDANNPERNYTLTPTNLTVTMGARTNLRVEVDSTKEIRFTERGTITYKVSSFDEKLDYTQDQSFSKIDKAYLVLPSDVNVKRVTLKMNNTNITAQVTQTKETRDGKTIYTFDFANVEGLNRYVGWLGDYGQALRENRLTAEVQIENQVSDAMDVPYDQTFFVQAARKEATLGSSTVNNRDPHNLVDHDELLFTNRPTTNYVRLSKQDRLDLSSSAKLDTNLEYSDSGETFVITDENNNLELKYDIKNPTTNDVNGVDMFIPIPKKEQHWGSNFQDAAKPFDYSLQLLELANLSGNLSDILDVSYATVSADKLTGATTHTTQALANENFTSTPTDFSSVNLVRLKVKDGKTLPAKFFENVRMRFSLTDITTNEDGKTIAWNPYYAAQFTNHSTVEKAGTTAIQLKLGKLKVQVFKDDDRNGSQEGTEENWANVLVTLLDSTGEVIATKQTNGTSAVEFEELISGQTYKIDVKNPNTAEYNFTTTGENTLTNSVVDVIPTKTTLENTPVTKVGLGRKQYLIYNPTVSAGKTLIDGSDAPDSVLSATDKAAVKDKVDTSNLPDGTVLTPADKVSGTAENPVVKVTVTYPDGTTDTVDVPVKQKDSVKNEPTLTADGEDTPAPAAGKALIDGSDVPESSVSPADKEAVKAKVDTSNLPDGTVLTPADKVSGTPENPVVKVTVTYPDGTTDTVDVPVKQKDSVKNEPTLTADGDNTPAPAAGKALIDGSDAPESAVSPADKEAVKAKVDTSNLPDGTVLTPADKVSGTAENPVVEVTVTYPDGTTDTIEVPVKQKDSAKNDPSLTADNNDTPESAAGKALIDGSDVPESAVSPADKEAVKAKVDTSNLPDGTVLTPADKVSGTPENPVVEVTVTYPDGTTDTIEVPVKQKDSAKNDPSLTADGDNTPAPAAGKALIDGSDAPESAVSPADKEAVKAKVDTSNLPEGTVLTPADKVSGMPENPVVEVTVTYPDGTTDTINVPVKQKDKAKVTPELKPDGESTPAPAVGKALIDGTDTPGSVLSDADKQAVKDKVNTDNLPEGTTLTPADEVSGTPENPVVKVEVTYPDGTTDTINVPVKQKDKAKVTPELKPDGESTPETAVGKALIDGTDTPGSVLSDADKQAVKDKVNTDNLPEGTTLTPADEVSGTPENPVVEVTVTYPDGTTDTVNVPVKQKDNAKVTPELKPDGESTPETAVGKALIDGTDTPGSVLSDADKQAVKDKVNPDNLPDGTVITPADEVSGTADNPVVKVEVTYPDGTTDTINVPVKQKDNAKVTPELKPDGESTPETAVGKALIDGTDTPGSVLSDADKQAVKDKVNPDNLPDGTVITPADEVSGTPENPVVEVTVTYPDGTTDTINVPVKQKDNAKVTPELKPDGESTPESAQGKALIDGSDVPGSALSEADKEAVKDKVDTSTLPEGTTLTPADKVSGTSENPVVEVTVTYPDGTTDTINVPVKQKDNAKVTPELKPDGESTPESAQGKALIDGSDVPGSALSEADKEAVKDKVDTSTLPEGTTLTPADKVSGTADNPVVEVTVTYPDGTTDTINVPVKQKDSAKTDPTLTSDGDNTPAPAAGKALTDGTDTPGSVLSDADKQAVKDKVNTDNLPEGTTLMPADKVSGTAENPVVEVTVTYPDGTTDTVNVPVKQKDNAKNEPTLTADGEDTPAPAAGKALIDGSDVPESAVSPADKEAVKAKVDTSNLPEGTTLTSADKVSGTAENPVVEVTVTYPDGTTDIVNVPVKQKDNAKNEPTLTADGDNTPAPAAGKALIDGSDAPESAVSPADKEAVKAKVDTSNLPEGTVLTPADKVSGTPENPVVEVTVTYPDGTMDTINVPVKQKDKAKVTPELKPDGESTPETAVGKALIDGTDTPGSVLSDADKQAVKDKVNPDNLPDGTVITPADEVSGTPENPVVEVTVTYPDGTTDTINVPVKQKDNAKVTPELKPDGESTPETAIGKALIDGTDTPGSVLSDADKQAVKDKVNPDNLPDGTVITPADEVSGTADNPVVKVTVTYPDGTTTTIEVPVKQKVRKDTSKVSSTKVNKAKQNTLPKTGTKQNSSVLSLAGVMSIMGGIFLAKRRKEEEEQ